MKLYNIIERILLSFNIDKSQIDNIRPIDNKVHISSEQKESIEQLIIANEKINNFKINKKAQVEFNILKKNFATMQINTLSKIFKSTNVCQDTIDDLVHLLNKQLKLINKTFDPNGSQDELISQHGGNNNLMYYKYIKYKIKC